MKVIANFLRVLGVLLAIATLVSFFFPFVDVVSSTGADAQITGAQLAFGGDLSEELGANMNVFKSGYYTAAIILTVLTALCAVMGFVSKKRGWNATALITGTLNAILMVVFMCNRPEAYVDMGRVSGAAISYTLFFTLAVIAAIATVVFCLAGVLAKDAIQAKETGNLTIPKRIVKFLREYKSELKKVVWPGPRSVVKNTVVVLAVCGVALLLIWLVDLGLGSLFDLCFGTGA